MRQIEPLHGVDHTATAATAVADIRNLALHVVGDLYKPGLFALLKNAHRLGRGDPFSATGTNEHVSCEVE